METVEYFMEQMVPELEALQKFKLFTKREIKSIIKKRRHFEYCLKRRVSRKSDYLRYIEYELNLEELRKSRKLEKGIKHLPPTAEFSGTRRIHFIFDRLLTRFPGDKRLWIQFIKFAKEKNTKESLGKIFAKAIQAHPLVYGFWILSASFEYEENKNMNAARTLMQRAIRLNPEVEKLWLEYFKLELLYREKLMDRKKFLLSATIEMKQREKELEEQNEKNLDDETIIPLLQEEVRLQKDDVQKMELESVKVEEDSNPFFEGAIPKAIFQNAIQAIPNSIPFRMKFVEVYRLFSSTTSGQDEIYESLSRDFGDIEEVKAILISRPFFDQWTISPDLLSLQNVVETCSTKFLKTIEQVKTSKMWEEYLQFLEQCKTKIDDLELSEFFNTKFLGAYQKASKDGLLSKQMLENWIDLTIQQENQNSLLDASKITEKGLKLYPNHFPLWEKSLLISISLSLNEKIESLLVDSKVHLSHQELKQLWVIYLNWILSQSSIYSSEEIHEKFLIAMKGIERDNDEIVFLYLDWVLLCQGIENLRSIYQKLLKSIVSVNFIKKCIQLESSQNTLDVYHLRILYEILVDVQQKDSNAWLEYIKFEMDSKQFEKATSLYWKAMKSVENPESFVSKYDTLLSQQ